MQAKLKTLSTFESLRSSRDCLGLLRSIQGISYKMETQQYPHQAIYSAMSSLYSFRQHQHQSNSEYLTKFKNLIKVIEHYGGAIALHSALIKMEMTETSQLNTVSTETNVSDSDINIPPHTPSRVVSENFAVSSPASGGAVSTSNKEAIKRAKDKYIAYCFLHCSDPHRYGTLLTMLSNQYLLGHDQYPSDLTQTYGMLVNYKVDKTTKSKSPDSVPTQASDDESDTAEVEEDMTFLQHGNNKSNDTKATREQYSPSISNSNFQEAINLYMDASTSPVDGTSLDTTDFSIDFCCTGVGVEAPTLEQNYDHIFTHVAHIDSNWVLLDTQSTVHLFKPSNLLTNIHTVNDGSCLTCYSNGGSQRSTNRVAFLHLGQSGVIQMQLLIFYLLLLSVILFLLTTF